MTHTMTVARSARRSVAVEAGLVLLGAAALAASARVALPIGPVPITAQTLAVVMLGALLGSARGTASVLTYLTAGLMGAPVFVMGGGAAYVLGPTGGYLLGFLPGAWLVGRLAEMGWTARPARCAAAVTLGLAAIFALGVLWLSALMPLRIALTAGVLPFIPGEALKVFLAATILTRAARK